MSKNSKKSTAPTHRMVVIPNEQGTYRDPDGNRVNILKVPIEKNLSTTKPVFEGTTITRFTKQYGYSKA